MTGRAFPFSLHPHPSPILEEASVVRAGAPALTLTHLLERLNEQGLRRVRVRYREELPLDEDGYPLYLPAEMRQAHSYQSCHQPTQERGYSYE